MNSLRSRFQFRALGFVTATALLIAVAAAWSAPAGAVSTLGTDPCKLVTAAEAQTVLGVPVGAPESTPVLCVYSPASGEGATLTVIASRTGNQASNQANFEKARSASAKSSPDLASLAGVGDAAYSVGAGHFVVLIKGDATVSLMVAAPGSAKAYKERLIQAAKIAAGRL